MDSRFEPIIGLEIHVELKTASKMFCGCKNDPFHAGKPNIYTCPVCLGLPGALPVPNKKAVEWCVMLGLALDCQIPLFSKFDRKNYFYPDLPKGYQISQYDKPFAVNGCLIIPSTARNPIRGFKSGRDSSPSVQNDNEKVVRIRRVHMEEDTGKLLHATVEGKKCTLIDFNRSGVPLVEIVTEPDIRSSEEARIFLKKLYQIIRYLGISDADMEKGSMRLEPNISVKVKRKKSKVKTTTQNSKLQEIEKTKNTSGVTGWSGAKAMVPPMVEELDLPNYKVEVKNINSFNFAKKAIDYEIERQIEILNRGEIPKQETRGWDEKKGVTYSQRSKEEAQDYQYFPEPDIPPVRWSQSQILNLKSQIPELPEKKIERFMKEYGLNEYDAIILTDTKEVAEYYKRVVEIARHRLAKQGDAFKTIANWIINKKADITKVSPEKLVKLIIQKSQKLTISDEELERAIKKVLDENSKAVADYKSGKQQVIMYLVGQVMREVKGKGEAEKIKQKLKSML